ncbi:hypothetical protein CRU98_13280 [Arcobacter sp. CECT 8986]|uniref:hypothetical protein n=1 Tax=Arcobacter sp. CECT 8986 TaxID=2044507 RepID=UPI0010098B03|nr:hypothetical protein [Arcobacter sp. CECT 8986]RXJ97600.1 hypothetical protein CRU98_13280 [Arcobacter sp. CECT 8986]
MTTNRNVNSQEVRETNSENLADIKKGAQASFLEMIDSLISSYEDNIKVTLKETDKAKIRNYYQRWFKEVKEIINYIIIGYIGFTILLLNFLPFELGFLKGITENEVIYKGGVFLLLYLAATGLVALFTTEKNIERYFYHLYPQMHSISHKNKVAIKLLDFLFTKKEQEETDYKKFIYGFVPLFVFMFVAPNLQIFVTGVTVLWVILVMSQEKRNNVFWRKGNK